VPVCVYARRVGKGEFNSVINLSEMCTNKIRSSAIGYSLPRLLGVKNLINYEANHNHLPSTLCVCVRA
jgi:hypothetical protein